MTFTSIVTPSQQEDVGADLSFLVHCDYCKGNSPSCSTENAAVGAALGLGWKISTSVTVTKEFIDINDLTFGAKFLCPRCFLIEFEL